MRYYYKTKDGKSLLNLKSKSDDKNLIEITEEEFNELQPKPYEPTAEQIAHENIVRQISEKKAQLAKTDYKCLKFVDGELSEEEYAEIRELRHSLRVEINELESEL